MDSIKQRANKIITKMNLDEKLAQLGSYWMYDLQTKGEIDQEKINEKLKHGIGQITRIAGASTLDPVNAAKAANRLQKFLLVIIRGLPSLPLCMRNVVQEP
jgi:beta-glucosidase